MKNTDELIVVEQTFTVSLKELWNAITELNQMKQWFFENIPAFEPKVGFETRFVVENEGRVFPHLWKITEVEPFKKIIYNWRYEGYPGNSNVSFELSEQNNQTKLKLVHQVIASFSQDIPEFQRESCVEGWRWFLKQRLKNYLKTK